MMTFYQASDDLKINKILLIITIGFITFNQSHLPAQSPQKTTLTGQVYDAETNLPLQATNVFIANSMLGAATDSAGHFTIRGVPTGTFELVVSMIGYEIEKRMLTVTGAQHETLIFKLTSKVLQAPDIVVSAKDMKEWRRHLKKFVGLFFSNTENAAACKILNPEVLDFATDKPRIFRATAKAPLEIENRALGYKLYYILERFEFSGDFLVYAGTAKFEELAPNSTDDKKRWQDSRLRAYNGSLRHFLTALVENFTQTGGTLAGKYSIMDKEPLNYEGFYVLVVKDPFLFDKDPHAQKGSIVNTNRLLAPGELGFERKLVFSDYLQVIYTEETEEEGYLEYLKDFVHEPNQQISWIRLPTGSLLFNTTGYPYDPLAIETHGYWAWQRVADMLPFDYVPSALPSDRATPAPTAQEPITLKIMPKLYRDCLELAEDGQWREALKRWQDAHKSLRKNDAVDPRIGFAFIKLATENAAEDYYEKACDMYYLALSDEGWIAQPEAFLQEAGRVMPLLPDGEAQRWRELVKKKDKSIATELAQFWIEKDPTPSTPYNERLIQHWQRIAYARKNFLKSIKAPYQTDDRGVIYVKYGEPDRMKSLFLGTDLTELMRWSELAYDSTGGIGLVSMPVLQSRMERFMHRPQCEIWTYHTLNDNENVIFIFGDEEGTGSFRLVNGIEDLIHRRSFSRLSARQVGLPAGSLLQMMYYGQLIAFDSYFENRYRELESTWERALSDAIVAGSTRNIPNSFHNTTRAIITRFEMMDRDNPARRYAPPEQSEFSDLGRRIRLSTAKVRMLDSRNQPQISFVAFAIPEGISKPAVDESTPKQYDLTYSLILRDSTMREIARFSEGAVAGLENTVVFTIADKTQASHFTIAAEAVARDTLGILGSGQAFYAKDPPLDPDPQKLEVSDLAIGILPPENADFSSFPFPILPSRKIWRGDALQVYFEAYHLKPDADNAHRFSVEVRVTRLEKKKNKIKRREMISSTFDFRSAAATAKEFFGVDIEKLKKGNYELSVEVVDKISLQRKARVAMFEVLER